MQLIIHVIRTLGNKGSDIIEGGPMKKKLVFAHLLTWFKTPKENQSFEMWQSEHEESPHDPNVIFEDGRRDIASVHYPLTDIYDSADDDAIEYQFLLMRMSGIDGVVIDWDGRRLNRYRHDTFLRVVEHLKKYNLKLLVCFEEWSAYWPRGYYENRETEMKAAKDELRWLYQNIANQDYYAEIDGKKPIFVFRKIPDRWFSAKEWGELKDVIQEYDGQILFNNVYDHAFDEVSDGWFSWIGGFDKNNSNSLSFGHEQFETFIDRCRKPGHEDKLVFGSVYPGFNDTPVWGWGEMPRIAPRYHLQRYIDTWESVINLDLDFVQIVTWNDWNEGSEIEPSVEYGFKYLELTRQYIDQFKSTTSHITDEHMKLPLRLYKLRKRRNDIKEELDDIARLIIDGRFEEAEVKLNSKEI